MWDLIINPFVTLLTLAYSLLGNNIILSIVVLTIVIRLLTYPLLAKQQESMQKTQALQPQLDKLKEKYKDEPEKLREAQASFYKDQGINPVAGCLPLLIQFPIIIGLYQAIFFALASTPFQIVDISERLLIPGLDHLLPLQNSWLGMSLIDPPTPPLNPIYALSLPLLVMVTTYLQSRIQMGTRPAPDPGAKPSQAAAMTKSMTTIMPVMYGAFALSFSVGLSIYFITSNVVGIIQYSPIGKRYLDRLFRTNRTPKEKPEEIVVQKKLNMKPVAKSSGKAAKKPVS